jgi:hypothetical protein
MSFAAFEGSLARDAAPLPAWSGALQALWHDAKGDWHTAHDRAQEDHSAAGSWVHAYLHRKEGDAGNAAYWYARAGRRPPPAGLELAREWEQIARALAEG